jgi:hypothetical protein
MIGLKMVNFIMTNSIQQNASTIIFKVSAGTPGIKQVSQEDIKLFRTLLDSLNSLSVELLKLDGLVGKKLMEK